MTPCGAVFRAAALSSAHPKYCRTCRKAVVRINDRGPFARGRIIDLTPSGARVLGLLKITHVSLAIVSAADTKK
ncbi:MAG: septal ring lytic transglycosylase RlpA family protein [Xanthobacteraceae bacterium]